MPRTDLRQAAITSVQMNQTRRMIVTIACCIVGLIGSIMTFSYIFAGSPSPPRTCGTAGVYRIITDPKPDGVPYLTVICRNGDSWFRN